MGEEIDIGNCLGVGENRCHRRLNAFWGSGVPSAEKLSWFKAMKGYNGRGNPGFSFGVYNLH